MEKHFNKELLVNKKDNQGFNNSTKCWICDNNYNDIDVKALNQVIEFISYFTT